MGLKSICREKILRFLRQNHVRGESGLIFAVSSGLVNYLGTWIMFSGIYFCDLKMVVNFPLNKSLANINEFTVNHSRILVTNKLASNHMSY